MIGKVAYYFLLNLVSLICVSLFLEGRRWRQQPWRSQHLIHFNVDDGQAIIIGDALTGLLLGMLALTLLPRYAKLNHILELQFRATRQGGLVSSTLLQLYCCTKDTLGSSKNSSLSVGEEATIFMDLVKITQDAVVLVICSSGVSRSRSPSFLVVHWLELPLVYSPPEEVKARRQPSRRPMPCWFGRDFIYHIEALEGHLRS